MYTAGTTATACLARVGWARAATARRPFDGRLPVAPGRGAVGIHGARKVARRTVAMAAATTAGEVKEIHSSESTKTLLKSEALYEYMLNTVVYPRENEHLRELRLITEKHPLYWIHDFAAGGGAAAVAAAKGDGRPEHHRGRRLHGVLRAHHGARHPRRRQDRRHRRQPRVLRHRPTHHRKGRRRAQGRLPRGPRAAHPLQPARRRGERGQVRLRIRGRGQGKLRQLPRAAAAAGARRRRARLRQHALGRLRGDAGGRAADGGRQGGPGVHEGVQDRRRPERRGRAAATRRRYHAVPPPRLIDRTSCV